MPCHFARRCSSKQSLGSRQDASWRWLTTSARCSAGSGRKTDPNAANNDSSALRSTSESSERAGCNGGNARRPQRSNWLSSRWAICWRSTRRQPALKTSVRDTLVPCRPPPTKASNSRGSSRATPASAQRIPGKHEIAREEHGWGVRSPQRGILRPAGSNELGLLPKHAYPDLLAGRGLLE